MKRAINAQNPKPSAQTKTGGGQGWGDLEGLVGECRLDLIELGRDKPTFGKNRPRQFKIQIGEVRQTSAVVVGQARREKLQGIDCITGWRAGWSALLLQESEIFWEASQHSVFQQMLWEGIRSQLICSLMGYLTYLHLL